MLLHEWELLFITFRIGLSDEMDAGNRGGGSGMKRELWQDLRPIGMVISLATLVPLATLSGMPDPLGSTPFSIHGGNSGVIPFALGHVFAWPVLLRLRKHPSPRPGLAFITGLLLSFVPALFYACTAPLWSAPAPLWEMMCAGLVCGILIGACAVLYFRGSNQRPTLP